MDPLSKAQNSEITVQTKRHFGTPFRKGQSWNPGGRPKRKYFTKLFHELLKDEAVREEAKESMRKILTAGRGMAPVLLAREMSERLEGKVTQPVEIEGSLTLALAETVSERRKRLGNNSNSES